MKNLSIGQKVEVVVERVLPFGVFVLLNNGDRAYIRRRELDLDADVDPHSVVMEGEQINAIVLQANEHGRYTELSRRATLQDPWVDFNEHYRIGSVVRCTVRALHPNGVFVRIQAGVDGFVSLDELTTMPVDKPDEVLWIGDETEATILRIEPHKRHVTLSIKARMKQYDQALDASGKLSDKNKENTRPRPEPVLKPLDEPDLANKVGPIMIAEDDDYVGSSMATWLRQQNFEVHLAMDMPQAIDLQSSRPCCLYFIDLDLQGNDGLELIHHLRKQDTEAQVCVMSTPERLAERAADIEAAQVLEVFPKPLEVDEIGQFLVRIARKEVLPFWRVKQKTPEADTPFEAFGPLLDSYLSQLQEVLEEISTLVRAQTGILFRFDPDTQAVSIVALAGEKDLDLSALYGLNVSPVKDVIQEGGHVFEKRVTERAMGKFEKLLALLPFESCMGVPVKVHGEIRHAVFFFHPSTDAFSNYRLRDIQAGALLLAERLTEEAIQEQLLKLNPMMLSGELAASFGHDVFNKITALELEARNLAADPLADKTLRPQKMLELVLDLKNTVYAFQQMLRVKEKMDLVDVNSIIDRAGILLRDTVKKEGVKLVKNLLAVPPPVMGSQTFLQQSFLNIMLNAIQQMILKTKQHGWNERPVLEIVSCLSTSGDKLQIRFKDNGPGIHKVHHAKLFSPGFSTRGGSGLGLYIARSFLQAMGATLQAEESFVPLGTTFLVEIPVVHSETKEK